MGRHLVLALAATGTWREGMYAAPTANVAKRAVSVSPSGQVELLGDGDAATILQETWELEVTPASLDAMLAEADTTLAILQEAFASELMIAPSYVTIQTTPALEHTNPSTDGETANEASEMQMSFAEAADRAKSWEEHKRREQAEAESAGRRHDLRIVPVAITEEFPPNFAAPTRPVAGCLCQWDNKDGGECNADQLSILKSMGVSPRVSSPTELNSAHGQRAFASRFVAAEALCQSIGKGQALSPTAGDCAQCSGRSQCHEAWSLARNEQISQKGVIGKCSKAYGRNDERCSAECLDAFGCFLEACQGSVLETRVGGKDTRTDFNERAQVEDLLQHIARSAAVQGDDMQLADACRPHFERATILERNVEAHECSRWVDGVFSVFMESRAHDREPADVRTLTIEFDIQVPEKEDPKELELKLGEFDIDGVIDRVEKTLDEEGVKIDEVVGWKELTRGGTGARPVEAKESSGDATEEDSEVVNEGSTPSAKKGEGTLQVVLAVVVVIFVIGTGYGVYKMSKHKDDDDYEAAQFEEEEEEEYEEE